MKISLYNSVGCLLSSVEINKEYPNIIDIALVNNWILEEGDYITIEKA